MIDAIAIQAENLTLRYGRRTALETVDMAVHQGTVHAVLGRNGAGKSSLVRTILGQMRPAAGRVSLFGKDVWRNRTSLMNRIGVVAEESDIPGQMTVDELGRFSRTIYRRWSQRSYETRVERFDIPPRARVGDLSKGQKKQVSLAAALAMNPDLLVLDDPTLGLDVVARKSLFEEVIADLSERGITVFVTTHDLSAIETLADRVAILHGGRILTDEGMDEIRSRFRRIRYRNPPQSMPAAVMSMREWGSGKEAVISNFQVTGDPTESIPTGAEVSPMTLEEIFIAIVGEQGASA